MERFGGDRGVQRVLIAPAGKRDHEVELLGHLLRYSNVQKHEIFPETHIGL